jgi:hypothetical protein
MTPRSSSFRRRCHDHATLDTSPATTIATQTIVTRRPWPSRGELESPLLDCHPRVQFGEIDADAAFTGTWTHVHRGPVLRFTQATLHPRLRPVTNRALVRTVGTVVGGPHDEPSWHRFEPRLERRYIPTSHFNEAGGRCRPEAQERIFIVHFSADEVSSVYCWRSYTVTVVTTRPDESTPFVVVVIVLPSADTVTVDFAATRPPILTIVP